MVNLIRLRWRIYVTVLLCLSMATGVASAQVRSSSNYSIQSDTVNVGGGLSSSPSFQQESTVGEVATGVSTSSSFSLRAGYQQMQPIYISLAGGDSVVLQPAIPGLTGGESNGSTTVTVVTDNAAGYQLTIESESDDAMRRIGGGSINDYTPSGFADYEFSIPAGTAEFGYAVEGADVVSAFLHNGTSCGVGTLTTPQNCWKDLSTAPILFAQGGSNQPAGATTTLHFRVEVSAGASVQSGTYVATTTVTALPL